MKPLLAVASLAVVALPASAAPPVEMTIPCQQNLSDGRILVDGTLLPREARYNVRHYRPQTNTGDGWSRGECRIVITKGASG